MGRHKINKVNPLALEPIDEDAKETSKNQKLIRNLLLGMKLPEASLQAGFSASYSTSGVYQKFKSARFQNEIKEFCLAHNIMELPRVMSIYHRALNLVESDLDNGKVENLSKLKHIPKKMLQMGGLLADENKGTVAFVNVDSIRAIISQKMGVPFIKNPGEDEEKD